MTCMTCQSASVTEQDPDLDLNSIQFKSQTTYPTSVIITTMPICNDVWALLTGPTVTDVLSRNPTLAPGKVGEELFSKKEVKGLKEQKEKEGELGESQGASYDRMNKKANLGLPEDGTEELKQLMDKAASTGAFPYRPSDLFLKVYRCS